MIAVTPETWEDFLDEVYSEAKEELSSYDTSDCPDYNAEKIAETLIENESEDFEDMLENEEFTNNAEILDYLQDKNYDLVCRVSDIIDEVVDQSDCPVYSTAFEYSFTGSDNNSRTCCQSESIENMSRLIWDWDTIQAFVDLGYNEIPISEGAEAVEVLAYTAALNQLKDDLAESWLESLSEAVREIVNSHDLALIAKYQDLEG